VCDAFLVGSKAATTCYAKTLIGYNTKLFPICGIKQPLVLAETLSSQIVCVKVSSLPVMFWIYGVFHSQLRIHRFQRGTKVTKHQSYVSGGGWIKSRKTYTHQNKFVQSSLSLPDRRWPSLPPKMLQTWQGTELASWHSVRQSCTSPSRQRLTDAALAFSKASSQGVWILHHKPARDSQYYVCTTGRPPPSFCLESRFTCALRRSPPSTSLRSGLRSAVSLLPLLFSIHEVLVLI
jgi:hypothetical protein